MPERAFDVPAGYAKAALGPAPRAGRELWVVRVPEEFDVDALDGVTIQVGDEKSLGSVAAGEYTFDLRAAQPATSAVATDSSQLLDMATTRDNQFFDALDMHGAAAELASTMVLVPTDDGTLRLDKKRALRRLYLALRPPAPRPARMPSGGGALGKKTAAKEKKKSSSDERKRKKSESSSDKSRKKRKDK
ncbi:hypothetical protein MCUN1_001149 [Malassezia cuniculi]|uniref:Uncharacterized protein n=1 Tax=Malassezia cuniculi TaxID=948313 RepID=A0AAF0ESC1_9BASI|nr:hypothetical protein MCUN1_001149 [Malassezia cuniculi]